MLITENELKGFKISIEGEEFIKRTVKQYVRVTSQLMQRLGGRDADKAALLEHKAYLAKKYKPTTANVYIAAINKFLNYMGRPELKLKSIRVQQAIYADPERKLERTDVIRLCKTALRKGKKRLYYMICALIGTGMRVSEPKYITVEALRKHSAHVDNKAKHRDVPIPKKLRKMLLAYAREQGIKTGPIFITGTGKPVDPSNLLKALKKLAEEAGVDKRKVFPHNFRHLFARMFYELHHDIVRLADILGHSSINTTRIYIKETGEVHRKLMDELLQELFA